MPLPPPRDPTGPYRICCVCLGNICRSPMADAVLRAQIARPASADRVIVDSAGTGDWHVGERMHRGASSQLNRNGYDGDTHRARQFDRSWLAERDLVLAMDASNLRDLRALAGARRRPPDQAVRRDRRPARGRGPRPLLRRRRRVRQRPRHARSRHVPPGRPPQRTPGTIRLPALKPQARSSRTDPADSPATPTPRTLAHLTSHLHPKYRLRSREPLVRCASSYQF